MKYDYKFFVIPLENEFNKNKIKFEKDLIENINLFSASIYNVKYVLPKGVTVKLFSPKSAKSNIDDNIYCRVHIGVKNSDFKNIFKFYRELIDDIFDK